MLTKFEETLTFSEKKIILVISHTTNFTQIVFKNLFSIFSLPWISGQLLETNYYAMVRWSLSNIWRHFDSIVLTALVKYLTQILGTI